MEPKVVIRRHLAEWYPSNAWNLDREPVDLGFDFIVGTYRMHLFKRYQSLFGGYAT